MRKQIIGSDCDILIFNSQGDLLKEFSSVPKEMVVKTLNRLNKMLLEREFREVEVPRHILSPQGEFWDRIDEEFDIGKPKLLPKPLRKGVKK